MVITLKEIKWTQTDEEINLRIVFTNGCNLKKWHISTSSNFIKIHCPPFFREIFLAHPINEAESRCRLLEDEVRFMLKKSDMITWKSLEKEMEPEDKIKMKEDIVAAAHVQYQQEIKDKIEKNSLVKRQDVRKVIEHESEINQQARNIERGIIEKQKYKIGEVKSSQPKKSTINVIPGVRNQGTIAVEFTDRRFTTPKRESQSDLEQEWIRKQYEARKVVGFVEENLQPHERNPEWLKEKGNDFFRKKNYLGAISAYSTALRLTPECYDLFLERSACHLAIGNLERCIEDCSKAYELLTPSVEANIPARTQCLARRGAALCKLSFLQQGLDELQAALKLSPGNNELQQDVVMIQKKLHGQ